jgi:5'-deoxynucleotidase
MTVNCPPIFGHAILKESKMDIAAFLNRSRGLSFVERWNFHPRIHKENVAEHSFWVAFYAMLIMDMEAKVTIIDDRLWVLEAALLHDLEEAATGDCPFLVKREIKDVWNEKVANKGFDQLMLPLDGLVRKTMKSRHVDVLPPHLSVYVKAGDLLDCIIYGLQEKNLGNNQFDIIVKENIRALHKLGISATDIIISNIYSRYGFVGKDTTSLMTHL